MSDPSGDVQPRAEYFARNLIGGRWEFPSAPFDYEIRSPLDGAVITAVPLSSRLDVARAVSAAKSAAGSWAADPAARHALLTALAAQLSALSGPLARLQAAETGLDLADSTAVTGAVNLVCQRLIAANRWQGDQAAGGKVSGHILSWGLPFAEVACAVTAHLAAGHTVVIKPSLRGPLSAAAFGQLATKAGFPAGVINIVQGTGVDVGTALIGTAELDFLQVRAGQRTLSQAERAAAATGVPASWLRAGGNIAVAGGDADVELVATAVTDALRTHSTGGPLALPFLCVQTDVAGPITDAIMAKLEQCRPAPLPAESLRDRALARIASLNWPELTCSAAESCPTTPGTGWDGSCRRQFWRPEQPAISPVPSPSGRCSRC